jgi:hypothetical protein
MLCNFAYFAFKLNGPNNLICSENIVLFATSEDKFKNFV